MAKIKKAHNMVKLDKAGFTFSHLKLPRNKSRVYNVCTRTNSTHVLRKLLYFFYSPKLRNATRHLHGSVT